MREDVRMADSLHRFDGKVIIVTGASSSPGIGLSCARRLGSEGAKVVINARDPKGLEGALQALHADGIEAASVAGSMTDGATAEDVVAAAWESFGRLDGLVATVGGAPHHASVASVTHDQLVDTYSLNIWPTVSLIQAAVRKGFSDRSAAIVTISSGSPNKTTATMAPYAAAKAALNALTRTMAADLRSQGIRVNGVSPGLTRTDGTRALWEGDGGAWAASNSPLGRMTEADDIAAAAAFLLSTDAAAITGVLIDVDGGDHLMGGGWSPFGVGESPPTPR